MKSKIILLALIIVMAVSACFAADGYKLKMSYKPNCRYTYKANDVFKLKSANAYGRNVLDQEYVLDAQSSIYERPLSVDKYGNYKLKTFADFTKVDLNGSKQALKQSGDFQVAMFSPQNLYKNIIQTSIAGEVKEYAGTKEGKYPVFVNYSDMISATFVLPNEEVQIGEKWYPKTIELANGGYINSEFSINQVKTVDGELLAYISGQVQAMHDVQSAVRFFRKVIPSDLIAKRYSGQAQVMISDYNVVFSITKGVVKKCEVESDVNLTITDPTNGMSMNAVLEANFDKELVKTETVK